jgi:hypothetical protein
LQKSSLQLPKCLSCPIFAASHGEVAQMVRAQDS